MMHENTTVLLVEDDEEQADLLAELLRTEGYDVVAVPGAEAALKALRARRFAVVVSDHHMPGKTGSVMLAEAKAAGLLDGIGALMLTASLTGNVPGGWRVLRKGIGPKILAAEIRQAILTATSPSHSRRDDAEET